MITFTATATDPDVGDTVTQYQWNFGDGSGIQTSAAVGRLMADLVAGRDPGYDADVLSRINPLRFGG